ncbi:MAG: ABC transporter substrate-binding protein [Phycisphaerae bacterium]|nr:ABC transporter substrate-binding protein [Phycisphaerae bacterium]
MSAPIPITLAHSPDPDDAFMWWPLFEGLVAVEGMRFEQVTADIETLNRRAAGPEAELLDVTALSCANAARVRHRYLVTACGASVGDGYGPKLVATRPRTIESLVRERPRIAVPGTRTTAFLAVSLLLGRDRFEAVEIDFERIVDAVVAGEVDAGVVIHEGQLTFESKGLALVEDLGRWWRERTGLALPLGVNAVRRDLDERLGAGSLARVCDALGRCVRYALEHRREGLARALRFARGIAPETADRFVDLYANRWSLDLGETGRRAVERLVAEAVHAGLLERGSAVDFAPSPLHSTRR